MYFSLYLTLIALLFSLVLIYYVLIDKTKSKSSMDPEPNGAWPIIGHIHLLGGEDQLLYRTFGAMANKYGPTFNIQLGNCLVFVVNSWEVAKDYFTVNEKALASRPTIVASKLMGYNHAMFGFAPYNAYWHGMRKIATLELSSNCKLELLKHIRATEIDTWMRGLYNLCVQNGSKPTTVELKSWLSDLTLNVVVQMVAGKRYFCSSTVVVGDEGRWVPEGDRSILSSY